MEEREAEGLLEAGRGGKEGEKGSVFKRIHVV